MTLLPNRDTPSVCFVAPDVDLAWQELGAHLLHDAHTYAEWNPGEETSVGIAEAADIDELRAMSRTHRIFAADRGDRLRPRRRQAYACAVVRRGSSLGTTCVSSTKR